MKLVLTWLAAAVSVAWSAPTAIRQLKFEQNKGQTSAQYSFLAKAHGQTLFLGQDHSLIELHGKDRDVASIRMRFVGAKPDSKWTAGSAEAGRVSYFVGNDRSRWVHDAPQYSRIQRKGIYPGVDLVMYGDGPNAEYDLILAGGADASRVRLQFESSWRAKAGAGGAIEVETPAGRMVQKAPKIYQESAKGRVEVKGRFVAAASGKNQFRLVLGEYDHTRALVVDPVIESASYYGGELDDQVVVAGVDYVAGNTTSVDFESVLGKRRGRDVFLQFNDSSVVSGYPNTGATPVYYVFGGSDDDQLTSAGPTFSGVSYNTYGSYMFLAGVTKSRDLPVSGTTGLGNSYGGGESDGFILRFGSAYTGGGFFTPGITAAYWGGSGEDRIEALAADYYGSLVITGSTTSPDMPVLNAFQPALAGAKDAFVASLSFSYSPAIVFSSYVGGTGDDTGWTIVSNDQGIYFAGETRSPDFMTAGNQAGTRQGPSDGFLGRILFDTTSNTYRLGFLRLIGGSGEDSIRALGVTPPYLSRYSPPVGSMAIVGTTNSPDFPVLNAAQPKLGGGTDAFVMRYVPANDQIIFSTYWGGSGDDAGTAGSIRSELQLVVAGNTRSGDFPVKDPVQPSLGGGQDGFLLLLSDSGQVQFSTYYGGAGDENVRSVVPLNNGPARLAGDTTSADLPGLAAAQEKDGGVDGFTADIGVPMFVAPDKLSAAKGGTAYLTFQLSQTNGHVVSVRTLDSTKVRLMDLGTNTLMDETRLAATENSVYIEALQDNGEAQVELTVDGVPARRVTIAMYPMVAVPGALSTHYTVWSSAVSLNVQFCAFIQSENRVAGCGYVRPQMTPKVTWISSNPAVASVGPGVYIGTSLQFLTRGTTTLTVKSDVPVQPPDAIEITVTGVLPAAPNRILLGKDLVTSFSGSFGLSAQVQRGDIHVRSSDPSMILLAAYGSNSSDPGVGEFTIPASSGFGVRATVQALTDHGEASVIFSSPDWDAEVSTTVELHPRFLQVNPSPQTVLIGGTALLLLSPSFDGAPTYSSYSFRYNAPVIPLRIISSDPTVAKPSNELVNYGNGIFGFPILAKAPGSAVLSVEPATAGAEDVRGTETITVATSGPNGKLTIPSQLTIGKDLQTSFFTQFSGDSRTVFTFTVADPSLALISTDFSTAGKSQLTVSAYTTIYVQGLASAGSTQLNITSADGSVTGKVSIDLAPSGLGFSARTVKLGWRETAPSIYLQAYALDPSTGFPAVSMSLRPGIPLNPSIATDGASASLSYGASGLVLQALDAGTTVFTLLTPDGFTPVPRRNRMEVTVVRSPLRLSSRVAIQNAMVKTQISGTSSSSSIKIDSGDPARLLLSNSVAGPGAVSIVVSRGQDFYLIGLASAGLVPVHASGDGYEALDDSILLSPLTMNLGVNAYSSATTLSIQSGTQASNLMLVPGGGSSVIAALGPGVTLAFTVTSSAPNIADVSTTAISLSGTTISANIPVAGKSPGSAAVSVRAPAGASLLNAEIAVTVTAPKFILTDQNYGLNLKISKDLVLPAAISLETLALLLDNRIVKITSLNPELLLVSRSIDGVGLSSTTIAFSTNSSREPVYLQALAGAGTAQIQVSADGFQDATIPLTLTPLGFAWSGLEARVQTRVGNAALLALVVTGTGGAFRQGAPGYTIPLQTDPPGAAALSPQAITFNQSTNLSAQVGAAPAAPGDFDVVATLPDGSGIRQPVTALGRQMFVNCNPSTSIGKDLYIGCIVLTPTAVQVRVTSSDPSLLVSANETMLGSTETVLDVPANNSTPFFVQSLASSKKANLRFQAAGYEDLTVPFTLQATGFVVNSSFAIAPAGATQLSGVVTLRVTPYTIADNGSPLGQGRLRPGAPPITVKATSSRPDVVILDAGGLVFQAGDSAKQFTLKPGVVGTSLVTITAPEGFVLVGNSTFLFEVK